MRLPRPPPATRHPQAQAVGPDLPYAQPAVCGLRMLPSSGNQKCQVWSVDAAAYPHASCPADKLAGSGKRMDPLPLNGKSVLQVRGWQRCGCLVQRLLYAFVHSVHSALPCSPVPADSRSQGRRFMMCSLLPPGRFQRLLRQLLLLLAAPLCSGSRKTLSASVARAYPRPSMCTSRTLPTGVPTPLQRPAQAQMLLLPCWEPCW